MARLTDFHRQQGYSTINVENGLHFHFVLILFRGSSCSSWKVSWIHNTGLVWLYRDSFPSLLHLLAIKFDQYILCNAALENDWDKVLLNGLTVGKGDVSPDDFYAIINKRIERVLIRTVRAASKHLVFTRSSRVVRCFLTLIFFPSFLSLTGRWFLPATHTCWVSKRDTG
jgi:hypothetical protein